MVLSPDQLKDKIISLSDQAWAGMRQHAIDIKRIANGGLMVNDERDRDTVRMVFCAVMGDLHLRAMNNTQQKEPS